MAGGDVAVCPRAPSGPPARVLELGRGPLGGFVPRMQALGYHAIGVDPDAPEGAGYEQVEFEHYELSQHIDALVASTSLHHVADLDSVLNQISAQLEPRGTVVIIEWAHERFDEATARWCFERLAAGDEQDGWLHAHRDHWQQSGQTWDTYFRNWIGEHRLHTARTIMHGLQDRFETRTATEGPLFFADLAGVTQTDEQSAIDAGQILANAVYFVGQKAGR